MRVLYAVGVPSSPPTSQRIYDDLRNEITSGRIRPGERLPSNAELAERYDTTPATVTKAFAQLRGDDLVETRSGSGTYARDPAAARGNEIARLREEVAEMKGRLAGMDEALTGKLDEVLRLLRTSGGSIIDQRDG